MFAQIEYPEKLLPEELDKYLAKGWFRMRQTIFTTNFLHFNQQFYSAIWLRVALDASILDKKFLALTKLNKKFSIDIRKNDTNGITLQHELLYQYYKQSVSFEVSSSLHELLIGSQPYNRFNTYEVNIYDADTLIAVGFFDLGKKSAAGITCIYHPAYKKYSLGKYLMYLKMDFCRQQQLQFFYPGYTVPGYTSFDYKLDIGKASLQYLQLSTQQWQPVTPLVPPINPISEMREKLEILQSFLLKKNLSATILYYKFFEVNLDPYYNGSDLFDFPIFLKCPPAGVDFIYSMIIYDVRDFKYKLVQCSSVINIGFQLNVTAIFDSDLLKVERNIFSTALMEKMCDYLAGFLKVV